MVVYDETNISSAILNMTGLRAAYSTHAEDRVLTLTYYPFMKHLLLD